MRIRQCTQCFSRKPSVQLINGLCWPCRKWENMGHIGSGPTKRKTHCGVCDSPLEVERLRKDLAHARLWANMTDSLERGKPPTEASIQAWRYCFSYEDYTSKNVVASDGWKVGTPVEESQWE